MISSFFLYGPITRKEPDQGSLLETHAAAHENKMHLVEFSLKQSYWIIFMIYGGLLLKYWVNNR